MPEAHEAHLHLLVCIDRLSNSWRTLKAIEINTENPLRGAAFRYALVEYSTAFTRSDGPIKKHRSLKEDVVPAEHLKLHRRVIAARHSVHAHADPLALEADLHVSYLNGEKYVSRIQNHITGLEELGNLGEVVALVETVLENLYLLHKSSEQRIAA